MKFVAPIPEQIVTTTMHFLKVPPDTSGKCTVRVPTCSGMGATKVKFWALSRYNGSTNSNLGGADI